jgi:enediyne biosynthesis protein E5
MAASTSDTTPGVDLERSLWRQILRFVRTPKGSLFLVLGALFVIATPAMGLDRVLPQVLAALAAAWSIEMIIGYGVRRVPTSALLSGLIVSLVLSPHQEWFAAWATTAAAVGSKYLLRYRDRHIFNPAALALLGSAVVFSTPENWWGSLGDLPWPLLLGLVAGGWFVADRSNKLPLVLAFAVTYVSIFTLVAFVDPGRVAEMYREPFVNAAVFFAFFMLTDPPTSPNQYSDQVWFGWVVGLASCTAQLLGAGQAYLLIGLLVGNACLTLRRGAVRVSLVRWD